MPPRVVAIKLPPLLSFFTVFVLSYDWLVERVGPFLAFAPAVLVALAAA